MSLRSLALGASLALSLTACEARDPLGCSSTTACPSGSVCVQGGCKTLCEDDSDCAGTEVCSDGYCATGARQTPLILGVRGTGSASASCRSAVDGVCFSDRLVVDGDHLAGASYSLEGALSFDLPLAEAATDRRATVLLPDSLVAGEYLLVASNQSGDTGTEVSILQGEPGPDATGTEIVTRLNAGATTGRLVVARLPTANDLITHLNSGDGTLKLSANILPAGSGGSMTGAQILTALNGLTTGELNARLIPGAARLTRSDTTADANAIAIPNAELAALCGDADGCTISMGMRYYDADGTGTTYPAIPATIWGQPCRVQFNADGNWAVSQQCQNTFEVWVDPDGEGATPGGTAYLTTYVSGNYDQDGAGDAWTILQLIVPDMTGVLKGGCTLAESGTTTGDDIITTEDATNTVHFWLAKSPVAGWFDHPSRACDLLVED